MKDLQTDVATKEMSIQFQSQFTSIYYSICPFQVDLNSISNQKPFQPSVCGDVYLAAKVSEAPIPSREAGISEGF